MINIVEFERGPIIAGEKRRLVLRGDGPFTVSTSCFVDTPPPVGFRSCPQCSTKKVRENEATMIEVSLQFWVGKIGKVGIEITDSLGNTRTLELAVLSNPEATPSATAEA
jgi:hypothetical protein